MPTRQPHQPITCPCGCQFTLDEWALLPVVGGLPWVDLATEPGKLLDVRACSRCGANVALEVTP